MKILTSNILFLLIAGVVVIGIGTFTYTPTPTKPKAVTIIPNTFTSNTSNTSVTKSYTASDVALHKNQASCWTIVNGNVYDLTNWIAQHPGGEGTILSICGVNGSAAFNNQHGGVRKPERILQSYFIGVFK
jgi:cytochrome b involved in lipid metabolism